MTTSTTPSEWFNHFYNHPNPAAPPATTATLSGQPSDSTVTSATIIANTATATATPTANYSLGQLGLSGSATTPTNEVSSRSGSGAHEARVSRPVRRRPRASRKNPTTLLNTDTTNFRAMVQRYTGGGSMAYPALESASPAAGFGGFQQGQMGNFNHLHGSMGGVDLRASQLHQQLLMQQHHGFAAPADMSASSARSHVGPQGSSAHLYSNSSSSMGDDQNKRGGFMF